MSTTIFINDIKQDYRHHAFFSPSAAGLGYSTLPPEAFGPMGGNDPLPEGMTMHDLVEAQKTMERMVQAWKMAGDWDRD